MGLKKFQIVFDNPWSTYYSGQPVTGRLLLTVDSPKKIRGIVIHFKGEAAVAWSETETRTKPSTPTATTTSAGNEGAASGSATAGSIQNVTVNYSSHEQYFENKFNLLGGSSGETELPAGDLCYPFATHLPPNLPSSFEGEHGHVRYTVKATLDRPWKFDQETKAAFTVISPLDLNTHPTAKEPVRKEVSKHFGFCCWSSGPLTITVSLPVSGYVPGQDIPVSVDVENNSDVPIREVKCTLRKLLTFTVTSPNKSTKKDNITIGELVLGSVEPHGTSSWTQVLKVPPLPPSNLNNCSIIDLNYDLKVRTVPLTSYQQPVVPVGVKPPGEVNGETANVHAGGATAGYNVPSPMGQPEAPENASWNIPSSDPDGQSEGAPNVQPNMAPQGPAPTPSLYPYLPPATFSESVFGPKNIKDAGDNQYTQGSLEYAPRYPVFNFQDK
ncbi:hypothetical protein Cfor_10395 [Coptotermes formosanus]|uniref:Arrestin C-terminal-like domain-containing protein n=1 Tax=Coptotermes formosanus TaxID=36987 RepID=A0A6L2PYP2_COPFO|nr:hypothetical protein Cfor_10395 [Coptotermes formosanus]